MANLCFFYLWAISGQNIFRVALLFGLYSPQMSENWFHLMDCLWTICFGFSFNNSLFFFYFFFLIYLFFLSR